VLSTVSLRFVNVTIMKQSFALKIGMLQCFLVFSMVITGRITVYGVLCSALYISNTIQALKMTCWLV
jgi:hypothetical protein